MLARPNTLHLNPSLVNEMDFGCLQPKTYFNHYVKRWMQSDCNHCSACLKKREQIWTSRLVNECKMHNYSVFFTLTYANEHVPYYRPISIGECDYLLPEGELNKYGRELYYKQIERGNIYICSNRKDMPVLNFVNKSSDFFTGIQNFGDTDCFAVVCQSDITKFFKRLRTNIERFVKRNNKLYLAKKLYIKFGIPMEEPRKKKHKYEKANTEKIPYIDEYLTFRGIREFTCSEYGPQTFRPHYHGLLWFEEPWLYKVIEYLVRKSWPFSHRPVRWTSLVQSTAPQYVAKYISGNLRLPQNLRLKPTMPFYTSSQSPSIGNGSYDYGTMAQLVNQRYIEQIRVNEQSKSYEVSRVPNSVISRFFPKCSGYGQSTIADKLHVYSGAFLSKLFLGEQYNYTELCHNRELAVEIYNHLRDIKLYDTRIDDPEYEYSYFHNINLNKQIVKYRSFINESFTDHIFVDKIVKWQSLHGSAGVTNIPVEIFPRLHINDINCFRKCIQWCIQFNMSPLEYVKLLDDVWYKVDMNNLRYQYMDQDYRITSNYHISGYNPIQSIMLDYDNDFKQLVLNYHYHHTHRYDTASDIPYANPTSVFDRNQLMLESYAFNDIYDIVDVYDDYINYIGPNSLIDDNEDVQIYKRKVDRFHIDSQKKKKYNDLIQSMSNPQIN